MRETKQCTLCPVFWLVKGLFKELVSVSPDLNHITAAVYQQMTREERSKKRFKRLKTSNQTEL